MLGHIQSSFTQKTCMANPWLGKLTEHTFFKTASQVTAPLFFVKPSSQKKIRLAILRVSLIALDH